MKPNPYHFFAAATTGAILIVIGLILFGCTTEPDQIQSGYEFNVIGKTDIPDTATATMIVCAADTFGADLYLTRPDTICIETSYGELRVFGVYFDIEKNRLKGKYVQVHTYYMDESKQFIPCRIFINKDGVNIAETCGSGVSKPIYINF